MNPADVVRVALEKLTASTPVDPSMHTVLFVVRIPRIIASVLVGAALSLSGAVYQGVFKNPLVSPDLITLSYCLPRSSWADCDFTLDESGEAFTGRWKYSGDTEWDIWNGKKLP